MLGDISWLINSLLVINRWIHIVGTTLLVGGILFFEFVVPLAVEDLKDEQRLAVFGRARWVFRKVIWISVAGMLTSGLFSALRMWTIYGHYDRVTASPALGPKPWFIAHVIVAILGMLMALRLTSGRRLLSKPVGWMQATLVMLLISIFLADLSRHVRLQLMELERSPSGAGARQVE